ncbi:Uncharacterised protein [Mycobacterium tuberculosis]|nr:Uncharacterised protein [Mycobacterium tuberculosis]
MVSRTTFRRASAPSGLVYGLSVLVDCTMPASSAACCQFRSDALMPKYVCAASCTPNELLPNETRFKYRVRISDFVKVLSSVSAIRISRSLRAGVVSTAARFSASVWAVTSSW